MFRTELRWGSSYRQAVERRDAGDLTWSVLPSVSAKGVSGAAGGSFPLKRLLSRGAISSQPASEVNRPAAIDLRSGQAQFGTRHVKREVHRSRPSWRSVSQLRPPVVPTGRLRSLSGTCTPGTPRAPGNGRSPGHGINGIIASDRGLAGVGLRGRWGLLLPVAHSLATGFRQSLPERRGADPDRRRGSTLHAPAWEAIRGLGVGGDDRRHGDRHASMEGFTASLDGEAQGADPR